MLPLKPLSRMLRQNCHYHISSEAIVLLRNILEELVYEIRRNALKEFEEMNNRREQQGLPLLKRLNSWALRKAIDNILKSNSDNGMGLQSNGAVSPGGDKMVTDKNATKPVKATDDQVEVV